jgi:pimeloyl-ACP methyl ester carboxylesterase
MVGLLRPALEVGPIPPHPHQRVPGSTRNRRPRRRGVLIAVAAVAAGVGVVWLALRDTSPLGHFTSAAAKDRFVTAYDRAMADLPPPQRTLDVRTRFGVVRVYRFAGAQPTKAPLVLLPGRASASPVWADNLPALLKLRSVYTIDLLGEPGLSIQDSPHHKRRRSGPVAARGTPPTPRTARPPCRALHRRLDDGEPARQPAQQSD